MKGRNNLIFDWRLMGTSAYVPIVIMLLLICYCYIIHFNLKYIIPALELTFPMFASWWAIHIFQELLEEPGGETIFSYPLSAWKLGIERVLIFTLFYLILMILMLLIIHNFVPLPRVFFLSSLGLQLGIESFFFSGFGFIIMVLTRSVGWSMAIVSIYASTHILTKGTILSFTNIFMFNSKLLPLDIVVTHHSFTVIFGLLFYMLGHVILKRKQKFN